MRIELLHNRIIADCITQRFTLCFEEDLVPVLEGIYPSLDGVLMYEDHLADKLMKDGEWYYPLTVFVDGVPEICWIKWRVDEGFKNGCPYSFNGNDRVEFSIVEELPMGFEEATLGRAISYPEGCIRVRVVGVKKDPTFLVGRYSQTFVDELARQISDELTRTLSVETVAGGTLELQIVFAQDTYMEHTSENVTYRRLLLTDKGCQPRDFWVKWTRLDSFVGYTMRDEISPDLIRFELGEDVPQKIREREYRFLCRSNPDKYQSAMGKKTVTEWRELIKRSIKRGDLVKVEGPSIEAPVEAPTQMPIEEPTKAPVTETPAAIPAAPTVTEPVREEDDLDLRLKAILGEYAAATSEPVPEVDDSDIAMMARAALGIEEPAAEPADDDYVFGIDMPADEATEEEPETVDEPVDDEPAEPEVAEDTDELPWDDGEGYTEPDETDDAELDTDDTADEPTEDEVVEEDEPIEEEPVEDKPAAPSEDDIRRELEARIRREVEEEARVKAEAERERMRSEQERLREENERLREEARLRDEEKARRENARIEEEERRREQERRRAEEEERARARIAEQARIEEAERARLAEIARLAVEEQQERERRDEEYRRQEAERLERERRAKEEEERRRAQPVYVTKHAKLIFRRPVDLSVLNRIKEIVESTIISEKKEHVHIYMKAYPIDSYTINLDMKLPDNEGDLLVTLVKAIGNGHLGITKIIVE